MDGIFAVMPDGGDRIVAYSHTCGVAEICALLAARRGLDRDLARVIGLVHDVYAWRTSVSRLHAVNGAELLRVAFKYELAGLFDEAECVTILSAVYHHSDKTHIHDAYDELLKDADALQHWLFDPTDVLPRTVATAHELGIAVNLPQVSVSENKTGGRFSRTVMADTAERLARKKIVGDASDADFMRLIRYFPENSAYGELVGAWCAAFVYHCCFEAGIKLPIRWLHTAKTVSETRFACVVAWYEWASALGYCFREGEGIDLLRGDIVVYDHIIPPEQKPQNATWCDHIGVVLEVGNETLTVAEGNADNLNVAGIMNRSRDKTVGCYIRIPDGYEDDGWTRDFKTDEYKVVNFGE